MKTITITVKKEVEIGLLQVNAGVRYWQDSEVNGESDTEEGENIPCKTGDLWSPLIELETGKILNWKQGTKAAIHYKVCDCCAWELLDLERNTILSGDGYVPDTLSPKENGYGDYIIMDINEDGFIQDWEFDADNFQKEED